MSRTKPTGRPSKQLSPGCLRLFFTPFLALGLFFFYFLTVRPVWQMVKAQEWAATPCVVESSQVVSHPGDDGSTYSIEVIYHYYWQGRELTSNRYQFSTGSSSARKSKARVVAQYPPGTETTCYVNPGDPNEAVINRGWNWEMAWGSFGLIFVAAGGGGIAFAGKLTRSSTRRQPTTAPSAIGYNGPGEWKPKHTPVAKFFGMLAFAVIWNGFIGVFSYFVFFAEDAGRAPIFVKIIIGLFALIGVAIIVGVCASFLALFNPRIRLTGSTTAVPIGGELHITWSIAGRAGMLRKLRVVLEGREEATYRRGTSTATDRRVFAEVPVFESSEREFLAQGGARVVVPAGLMHTFEAGNNKVLWCLRVRGEIPRWPDVDDEYPLNVLPAPKSY